MSECLSISRWHWRKLILDLRRRGEGRRESGAFLLAAPSSTRVITHICYDDLDPLAHDSGIIVFHGAGYVRLWELCEARQLHVIADVHTHPGNWTGQSHTDATHPMIGIAGHIALIVPFFAQRNAYSLRGVGIHRYRGDHQWQTCRRNSAFGLSLL